MMLGLRRASFAHVTIAVLAACGGDSGANSTIGRDEIVHELRAPGAPTVQLAVTPLGGGAARSLSSIDGDAQLPALSPDGRVIVFQHMSRLWRFDVGTAEARQLTFGPAIDGSARWSPDGQRVIYASRRFSWPRPADICIVELQGGDPVCLTQRDGFDNDAPDMSPDGSQVVWHRRGPDMELDLWIMEADGTNQRLLLDHSDADTSPQWSPDGRFILFRSFRYGPPCQFILELATGVIRPVLGDSLNPAYMESATWGPGGRSVIIEVLDPNNRFVEVDLETGATRFINEDTLSVNKWPSMRR